MLDTITIACPFVYANGRKCCGKVYRARAYGPGDQRRVIPRENVRKYRLWCSEKDDHAGIRSSIEGKLRMEFYPDELPTGLEDALWDSDLLS